MPSIPSHDKVYGYEEDEDTGRLIRQANPDPMTAGIINDSVGPGQYDNLKPSLKAKHAVDWSTSKLKRSTESAFI